MNVLVIGGGGREHAILKALRKSSRVDRLYCMKGNAGTAEIAENVDVNFMDAAAVKKYALAHPEIDYFVVTPDDPLAAGIVDVLESIGRRCFGPDSAAARIESSKSFAKDLMKKYGIPTAKSESFTDFEKAMEYVSETGAPVVIKADGLALGKGVLICESEAEAVEALREIMLDKAFGPAGEKVVIEEMLKGKKYTPGEEVSLLTFTDGRTVIPMLPACDHKRASDGDRGLNTGGMGAFVPCPFWTKKDMDEVMEKIVLPTVRAMAEEGCPFRGCLYFGLMRTGEGYKVIEYNSRFGDPETQAVLPMLKTDLMDVFEAVTDGTLDRINLEWEDGACVTVVLASGGYPVSYAKGREITIGDTGDCDIVHAGTARVRGRLVTAGGRVLNVVAKGKDVEEAREKAYAAVRNISWDGMQYRTDIGIKYREG